MLTVRQTLEMVYGSDKAACAALGVVPTAIINWNTAGQFPARAAVQICHHAKAKKIKLDVTDLPVSQVKAAASPAKRRKAA